MNHNLYDKSAMDDYMYALRTEARDWLARQVPRLLAELAATRADLQAALDREYDNQAKVPQWREIRTGMDAASAAVRSAAECRLDQRRQCANHNHARRRRP